MTTTADCTARAAAQLREAARDVARVAELRSRRAEVLPGSTQHGASAVPSQPDNLMRLVAARLTAAGFDVRQEDGDGGAQLDIGERWPLRTQLELAALDTAPGCARAHVCAVLREWRADPEGIDVAALVVSELLTNAVLSTRTHLCPDPVRMWMLGDGASVLFLVWDATVPAPVQVSATAGDEHGRGLTLINDLCERWGHYHPTEHPGGKVVWALLRAAPAPQAA